MQNAKEVKIDPIKADVFSLGLTAAEMMKIPFDKLRNIFSNEWFKRKKIK